MRNAYIVLSDNNRVVALAESLPEAGLIASPFDRIMQVTKMKVVRLPKQYRSGYVIAGRTKGGQ